MPTVGRIFAAIRAILTVMFSFVSYGGRKRALAATRAPLPFYKGRPLGEIVGSDHAKYENAMGSFSAQLRAGRGDWPSVGKG